MTRESTILPNLVLGEAARHGNLTMFPLLKEAGGEPDYLTLDEALNAKSARITEVSAGGNVPELRFVNDGDVAVLLLDGEELVGAKQNRVLNLTILAPGHKEIVIPVSCVEHGRWSMRNAEFASSPRTHHAGGRRLKMESVSESLSFSGDRRSDQGAVWADIAEKSRRMSVHSPTAAMSDIFEQHQPRIGDFVKALNAVEGQAGAVFAVNGHLLGLDRFDFPETLRKLLPKLVHSYALDAIDAGETEHKPVGAEAVAAMLEAVRDARVETFPAIGEGTDLRLHGPGITGAALQARGRTVHLSAFRWEAPGEGDATGRVVSRMSRASERMRPPTG